MVRTQKVLLKIAGQAALCIAVAGAAIFAVQVISMMTQAPEPMVDSVYDQSWMPQSTGSSDASQNKLRFAVATMVSAEETFSTYSQFINRISRDVGRKEAFIVRQSYEDVRLALMHGDVDVALVGTGTYISGLESKSIKPLVQAEFTGERDHRSLLLVSSDSNLETWEDLRDKVMAFTDRESLTGCLLPSAILAERGQTPDQYFRKIIYTGSNDRSIVAVSTHVVDAAAVMSLVWMSALEKQPSLAGKVRVIWQSQAFGPPLVVVPMSVDSRLQEALRKSFLLLDDDEKGRNILREIAIKRFIPVQQKCYASAIELYRRYQSGPSKR